MLMLIVYAVVTFLGLFGLHWYLARRLVRGTPMPPAWRRRLTVVVWVMMVITPVGMSAQFWAPRALTIPLAFVAYSWFGLLGFCMLAALPLELRYWIARLRSRDGDGGGPADPDRRMFLTATAAIIAYVALGGATITSIWQGMRKPVVRELDVQLAGLDPRLDGFRIVQLTDIHVGPTIGRDFAEYIVRVTNDLNPDLIAMTGDLVDGSVSQLAHLVEPIAELRAPHGVFFTTGNHEYYSGAQAWVEHARALGMRVLENESVRIERDGAHFHLAGVYDWEAEDHDVGHVSDIPAAMTQVDSDAPVVLMAHQPKSIDAAAEAGVALHLAGHTHGGQVWPFNLLVQIDQKYVHGLHRHPGSDTQIYVSAGTGYWGPPMRLGTRAEITVIRLRSV